MRTKRALFVAHSLSIPRIARRAVSFQNAGYPVTIFSFERASLARATFPNDVDIRPIGEIPNGFSWHRSIGLLRAWTKIRSRVDKNPSHIVLAFSLDAAVLAYLALRKKRSYFVYEVSDLGFWHDSRTILSKSLKRLERFILKRAELVIVTSPYFSPILSSNLQCIDKKILVLENKLPSAIPRKTCRENFTALSSSRIRIGFVGRVRYWKTLEIFAAAVAKEAGKIEFHLYGDSTYSGRAEKIASLGTNIFYHGAYKSPDDLCQIYSMLDLTYSLYPVSALNVQVALPNKLYESLYFGVPVLAANGTALANRIDEWGVGTSIDSDNQSAASKFLTSLTKAQLESWGAETLRVPNGCLVSGGDSLMEVIDGIAHQ